MKKTAGFAGKLRKTAWLLFLSTVLLLQGCTQNQKTEGIAGGLLATVSSSDTAGEHLEESSSLKTTKGIALTSIPDFSGKPYVEINGNKPSFTKKQKNSTVAFEKYSVQDALGRCGTAFANICPKLMPTEPRGEIGMVKPTGWHTIKYDCVDGKYLYNRCHLIAYELAAENANEKNLITGTRYMNIEGMLPFENRVAGYVKETGNHVLYRVKPIFQGNNLVAAGVEMEGYSVEDHGKGISFHIFAYNSQPGVTINYKNGESHLSGKKDTVTTASKDTADKKDTTANKGKKQTYILNTDTKKIHISGCWAAKKISKKNKKKVQSTIKQLEKQGYTPCQICIGK